MKEDVRKFSDSVVVFDYAKFPILKFGNWGSDRIRILPKSVYVEMRSRLGLRNYLRTIFLLSSVVL